MWRASRRSISHLVEILTRDLYQAHAKLNSTHRITHDGLPSLFYARTSTDFPSQYTKDPVRIIQLLDDKHFAANIELVTEPLQLFVGFQLPLQEKIAVLCGTTNMPLEVSKSNLASPPETAFPFTKLNYETDKLRQIGKTYIELQLSLNTVFQSEKFLSTAASDIEANLDAFSAGESIIMEFMQRNLLYKCLIPNRGTNRDGVSETLEAYVQKKNAILDKTSIGSFYALIGLLHVKYQDCDVITKKVINGPLGLINIALRRGH